MHHMHARTQFRPRTSHTCFLSRNSGQVGQSLGAADARQRAAAAAASSGALVSSLPACGPHSGEESSPRCVHFLKDTDASGDQIHPRHTLPAKEGNALTPPGLPIGQRRHTSAKPSTWCAPCGQRRQVPGHLCVVTPLDCVDVSAKRKTQGRHATSAHRRT